jgi:GNAT superfamily N-acetyltransferase
MESNVLEIRRFAGNAVRDRLDAVAALRITVFREWPYLYEGGMAYEQEYLAAYAASAESVFVLAFDQDRIVGASTGLPLADDQDAFQRPFLDRGDDIDRIFYFGESVLLPEYRGRGIGHAFFDHREAHARAVGRFDLAAFCAVDREPADARRPAAYRGNEDFWVKRGYVRQPGLTMHLPWDEIGRGEAMHALTFWTKPLVVEAQA